MVLLTEFLEATIEFGHHVVATELRGHGCRSAASRQQVALAAFR